MTALSLERAALVAVIAAALVAACGGKDAEPGAGEWEFRVDTVAGGHLTSFLRVVGKEGPKGEPQSKPVILSFDCRSDNAGNTIMTDQSLRQGSVEAELTVDGSKAVRVPGFTGTTPTGGQVVLTIPQESLFTLLGGHQMAIIAYEDGAGSSHTVAEFPVAGVETYRERFLAACAERK